MTKQTIVSFLVLLLVFLSGSGFAVDRSKFRTCDQTSFCRRHRAEKSASLYHYQLMKESLHFHLPSETTEEATQKDTGLWKSLSIQRLLGGDGSGGALDPYVKGPPPTMTGLLKNSAVVGETLQWSVYALEDGMVRMRVTEVYGTQGTPYEKARVTYDELILVEENLRAAAHARWMKDDVELLRKVVPDGHDVENYTALQYGDDKDHKHGMLMVIRFEPFAVYLYREATLSDGPIVTLNTQDMMHFEVRRRKGEEGATQAEPTEETASGGNAETADGAEKDDKPEKEIVGYWEDGLAIYADGTREEKVVDTEDESSTHRRLTSATEIDTAGMWEEDFQKHKDSKPHGPMSVGMDITFPASQHIFGLPEHASSAVLQATRGEGSHYKEPYRLYNLDVFEYELDETMALYGHVPLVVSHSPKTGTAGVFWFNPTETFVDVMDDKKDGAEEARSTHWISESGVVDVFFIPGPTPNDFYRQYTSLTGTVALPPMFSLGYHQCRWNYRDEKDVADVHQHFEDLDYPYDVLWLDIEHTDGKRYFTWDANNFPTPKAMQEKLWAQGRRMVTIIDPHIKRDDRYYIHKEATSKGLYIRDKDGRADYDGWCWPGSSSYLDFTSEKVRSWWADQFAFDKYKGSTASLFTWNDMNEPSVFNGPEVSMQKDLKNLNGVEHREWHNLYGMLFHQSTAMGQVRRSQDEDARPFVLTRSFFAGTQRIGPIWTGDNESKWSHLEISNPMLLSLNTAALSFVGADVGGFFKDPDAELMTRWMQAGAYQPFFRGHAHHDSKRREPWMFGEDTLRRLRNAAMARYALLPFWYSTFYESSQTGMPVMRMMWMEYPELEELFATDDQYMIGSALLVKPVTGQGIADTQMLFPSKDLWYDVDTMTAMPPSPKDAVASIHIKSDIDKIPVFQRGGSIIPRKLRLRRSSELMKKDPYTLYVALDSDGNASGTLYMDDEVSYGHEKRKEYAVASFAIENGVLSNQVEIGTGWRDPSMIASMAGDRMIERMILMGVKKAPSAVTIGSGSSSKSVVFDFDSVRQVLVLRKPELSAVKDWQVTIV